VPKEIDAVLTETLISFLPDWVKDLSAPLYSLYVDKFLALQSTFFNIAAFNPYPAYAEIMVSS